jgi:hypothetical protein
MDPAPPDPDYTRKVGESIHVDVEVVADCAAAAESRLRR